MNKKELIQKIKDSFNFYRTTNLTFRNMSRSDIYPLFIATKNEDFNKNLLWGAPKEEDLMIIEAEKLLRQAVLNQMAVISITDKNTGAWIGIIKFADYLDTVELGIWIHPDYWKTGATLKALYAGIEVVFYNTSLTKIYCATRKENEAIHRITAALGFDKVQNIIRSHASGEQIELVEYVLYKEKFKNAGKLIKY
jgi:RimJ/RimL family protein N-acetyltransferase